MRTAAIALMLATLVLLCTELFGFFAGQTFLLPAAALAAALALVAQCSIKPNASHSSAEDDQVSATAVDATQRAEAEVLGAGDE